MATEALLLILTQIFPRGNAVYLQGMTLVFSVKQRKKKKGERYLLMSFRLVVSELDAFIVVDFQNY